MPNNRKPSLLPLFVPVQIVSGGQTGVDRGGLEAAIALGIQHGGWCPVGRRSEDGFVPSRYELIENESAEYPVRTEQNVVDSSATLIMYERKIKGGTLLTKRLCRRLGRECLAVAIDRTSIDSVQEWLRQNSPENLNVAGPRESSCPGIQQRSFEYLMRVLTEQ